MLDFTELQPSTVETLKQLCTEERDTIEHMKKSGTSFEKAVALVILAAGGEENA